MISVSIQKYLNQLLTEKLGKKISSLDFHEIGGGSINNTYKVTINHNISFFLKTNSAKRYPSLFEKEKRGLEFLDQKRILLVPQIVACDIVEDQQLLIMEWIETGKRMEKQFWQKFGEQLARLHQTTDSYFGFSEDNYMGALPQINDQMKDWPGFFTECRLWPQMKIATEKKLLQPKHVAGFENIYKKPGDLFNNENPSLLHGDLWNGNYMCNQNSEPVLIDPAVYFGHRSMDLAMTTLFGGFDKLFYEAYDYHFPFPKNYKEQWEVCNLYPLLIHLNLFGPGYLGQIERTLEKFSK